MTFKFRHLEFPPRFQRGIYVYSMLARNISALLPSGRVDVALASASLPRVCTCEDSSLIQLHPASPHLIYISSIHLKIEHVYCTVPSQHPLPFPSKSRLIYLHAHTLGIHPSRSLPCPHLIPGTSLSPSPLTTSFCCTSLPQPYVNSSISQKPTHTIPLSQ